MILGPPGCYTFVLLYGVPLVYSLMEVMGYSPRGRGTSHGGCSLRSSETGPIDKRGAGTISTNAAVILNRYGDSPIIQDTYEKAEMGNYSAAEPSTEVLTDPVSSGTVTKEGPINYFGDIVLIPICPGPVRLLQPRAVMPILEPNQRYDVLRKTIT